MEKNRLATLLHREPSQLGSVHARRTEQLRCCTEIIQAVRMLPKTEGNANLFVRDSRIVRREGSEIASIMSGAAFYRNLEQPFGQPISSPA
jgi:hypothetical protein